MSLKTALQADLAAKGMNLGDLADKLNITQQSVSKWIAKDEIPKDRVKEVLALLSPSTNTATFLFDRIADSIRAPAGAAMGGKPALRTPPQPGDDDDDGPRVSFSWTQVDRRPPRSLAQIRQERVQSWASLLPKEWQSNVLQTTEINGAFRRFDYLSRKLALLVRPMPAIDPTRLIHSAVPLMLAKRMNPDLECKLVLLPPVQLSLPEPTVQKSASAARFFTNHYATVVQDLRALGVNVVEFDTASMLAAMIDAIENPESGTPPGPIFSYEDYPDAEFVPAHDETD